ncbi:MAG TPA: hypothetical protein DEG47_28580, partial [Cyanobacteria bacterium UBA11148]|nr:hypothetical protein [Cyanobacteria bacterium UBA11148]
MVLKSLRYILGLGIVGSLALTIAPGARAQVEVTGGEVTGDAAFFVPGMTPGMMPGTPNSQGKIELFDVGVRTLRIESPNGVTTRSRFVPTAARFTDTNNNRTPDRGDTFILQGGLSGVGFTQTGRLVTFSGRDTVLNATLDSFSEQFNVPGALISPAVLGEAPLVFLPGLQNVT